MVQDLLTPGPNTCHYVQVVETKVYICFSANGTLQPGEGDLAVAADGTGEVVEHTEPEPAKDTGPSVVNCHKIVF